MSYVLCSLSHMKSLAHMWLHILRLYIYNTNNMEESYVHQYVYIYNVLFTYNNISVWNRSGAKCFLRTHFVLTKDSFYYWLCFMSKLKSKYPIRENGNSKYSVCDYAVETMTERHCNNLTDICCIHFMSEARSFEKPNTKGCWFSVFVICIDPLSHRFD